MRELIGTTYQHKEEYVNTEGERRAYPLWQLAPPGQPRAQHRSEVAMVLTRCGHSSGWLDFLYYIDLRAAH